MRKLYFFDESERERILNLHESATKNQYLINETLTASDFGKLEVDLQSKTLYLKASITMERADGSRGSELKLNAGTKFIMGSSKFLVSKGTQYQMVHDLTGMVQENLTGDVYYYCDSRRFGTNKDNTQYTGEDFEAKVQQGFDDLCVALSQPAQEQPVQAQPEAQSNVAETPPPANNNLKNTPQPYKHAKHVTSVQNKLKEIDPTFAGGTTSTGQMDQSTINKLVELLKSKGVPAAQATGAQTTQTPVQSTSTSDLSQTAD